VAHYGLLSSTASRTFCPALGWQLDSWPLCGQTVPYRSAKQANSAFYPPEAADLAQNRPLWRMISTYGATQS